jgi:hypothetical protein
MDCLRCLPSFSASFSLQPCTRLSLLLSLLLPPTMCAPLPPSQPPSPSTRACTSPSFSASFCLHPCPRRCLPVLHPCPCRVQVYVSEALCSAHDCRLCMSALVARESCGYIWHLKFRFDIYFGFVFCYFGFMLYIIYNI